MFVLLGHPLHRMCVRDAGWSGRVVKLSGVSNTGRFSEAWVYPVLSQQDRWVGIGSWLCPAIGFYEISVLQKRRERSRERFIRWYGDIQTSEISSAGITDHSQHHGARPLIINISFDSSNIHPLVTSAHTSATLSQLPHNRTKYIQPALPPSNLNLPLPSPCKITCKNT